MARRVDPAVVEVAVLALWLGAAGFFSTAVAPAVFAVAPTRTLAGEVIGRLLPSIFYSGILAGAVLIGLEVWERRHWEWGAREIAGLVMIGACAIAQLFVGPRIERLREQIGGPLESLAVDDVRRVAFGRLHGASVAWLGVAMLAAIAALVLASRANAARH
ncbi:MAG: DUF4149 domain-containing protein [bacterium]